MALSLDERVGALRFAALITTALMVFGLGGHAAAAEISDLTVSTSWKKFCVNSQKTGFNGICDTRAEARKRDDNALLAAVEVIEREGEPKKTLRVIFPLGIQLTPGTRLGSGLIKSTIQERRRDRQKRGSFAPTGRIGLQCA